MSSLAERLKSEVQETEWSALRQHMARDALITVAEKLDLLEVAVATANDDKAKVATWINEGLLGKPSTDDLASWESAMDRKFRFVIVSPFVLIQKIAH